MFNPQAAVFWPQPPELTLLCFLPANKGVEKQGEEFRAIPAGLLCAWRDDCDVVARRLLHALFDGLGVSPACEQIGAVREAS